MRDKRGSLVINLMQTPNGFSVIEGTELLNRAAQSVEKQAQTAQTSSILNAMNVSVTSHTGHIKEHKPLHQRINLIIPSSPINFITPSHHHRYDVEPTINTNHSQSRQQKPSIKTKQQNQHSNYMINTTIETQKGTQWFSLSSIHENEINEIKLWYAEEHPQQALSEVEKSREFERYVMAYKKHRNTIVNLYQTQYLPTHSYLPASEIRKRIPYDAYWLMKVHTFLSNNSIINNTPHSIMNSNIMDNSNNNIAAFNQYLFKFNPEKNQYSLLEHQFDMNPLSTQAEGINSDQQIDPAQRDNETLKFITNKIRPFCDYCGVHCGIVWFYHFKQIDPKEITMIMKNVNSKNPPLSQKPYQMTLCTRCYCDGNFPLLLTHHDFKKTTVNDKLQPGKKKRLRKKKKDRKRKRRQRERLKEQKEQEGEDDGEEIFQQNQDRDEIIQEDMEAVDGGVEKIVEEQNDGQKKDIASQHHPITGKASSNEQIAVGSEVCVTIPQIEQQPQTVNNLINNILDSLEKRKKWTLQETSALLELVEEHDEDWVTILEKLNEQGLCKQSTVQDIITYFVSLPRRGVTKLKQEYEPQQFLLGNYTTNRHTLTDTVAERAMNTGLRLKQKIDKLMKMKQQEQHDEKLQKRVSDTSLWRQRLDELIMLQQQKIMNRIKILQEKQSLSMQIMRRLQKIRNW